MKKAILSLMISTAAIYTMAQGSYLEYKITAGQAGINGTTKVYAQDGNTRSVVTMVNPNVPGNNISTTLMLKSDPKKIYQLDDDHKTYSLIDLSSAPPANEDPALYDVKIIGKEKVNGYNATHLKVSRKGSPSSQELWLSTDIANYQQYLKISSQYAQREGLAKAMAAKGAIGFPIRVQMTQQGQMTQIDLVKVEQKNIEPAMFSLETYKKVESPTAGVTQDMINKIQTMTPEERKKFMEQMKQQAPKN